MRETRQVKPPLQLQVAHPPDWLPEAHTAADLGEYLRNCEERPRCSVYMFIVQVVLDITFHIPNRKKTS
jgi:hypothetical protein